MFMVSVQPRQSKDQKKTAVVAVLHIVEVTGFEPVTP